ncbi:MAG: MFS transporter [Proteiniphilum sp.]|jgi:GPH family glycoside/pentoside/hexuronide:cation symporter|nr:MFS transporter [Proteiniphilum sp.]
MITLREKLGYGFGDAASSMFWKLFSMYLMFFYTDIFGMEAAVVGTMFLITRVWDSFLDPVAGILADRIRTRWGRFRPCILFLALPFAVAGILTFHTPGLSPAGKVIYAYATCSLAMILYSGINVPYAALLGVISPEPKDRNILSTFRMSFAYIGSLVMLLLFMPAVNHFSGEAATLHDRRHGWLTAVTLTALLSAILFLLCFAFTRERVKPVEGKPAPLKNDLRDLLKNRPWTILLGAGISALLFNSVRDGAALYYFKYCVREELFGTVSILHIPFVLSGLYLALGQAGGLAGVILAAPLSNRIGKRRTCTGAMAVATLLSLLFFIADSHSLTLIFTLQALISLCAGSIFPLLWSMYADCADYSEYKTGNRATGLLFSTSSMSQKLGWAIGTAMTGWLLTRFGFAANQSQSAETLRGIKMCMSLIPAIGALLSVIFIHLYPLTEKRLKTITTELEKRRLRR